MAIQYYNDSTECVVNVYNRRTGEKIKSFLTINPTLHLVHYERKDPGTYTNQTYKNFDVYTKPSDWFDAMKDLCNVFTTMVMGILVATPIIVLVTIVALKAP
jgi:hypothetical protein